MIKALMHGCNGKMGKVISDLAREDEQLSIVAGVDPFGGEEKDYPVFRTLEDCHIEADVIIDFASASAVSGLLDYSVEKQIPVVVCTTGLSEEQLQQINEASRQVAVLKSANMSLGINTIIKLLKTAAAVLAGAGFDMEIVEKHHNQKVDAPSGTALALADAMNEVLEEAYSYRFDRSSVREKRPKKEIGFLPYGAEILWANMK